MFSIPLESCEVNKFREEALKFVDKVNTVLYPINAICPVRSPYLTMLDFIGKPQIKLIWYNNQLTSFVILHIIKEREICYRKV